MADRNTYITDSKGVDKLYPYTWGGNVFRENDPSNTVESSLAALEAQRFAIEIPLQASGWTGDAAPYQYRVNLTDMTDAQMPDMFLVAAGEDFTQDELDTYELLDNPQTYNGYLIIPTKAGAAKPSKDITVRLEGLTVPGDTSAAGVAALQAEVEGLKKQVGEMHYLQRRTDGTEPATISVTLIPSATYKTGILLWGSLNSNPFIGSVQVQYTDSQWLTGGGIIQYYSNEESNIKTEVLSVSVTQEGVLTIKLPTGGGWGTYLLMSGFEMQ